ncbi:hypothetical protein LSUE1_G001789 [Lachnellula suecica]|uniref:PAS-like domain-containing protein n=1 Tax=Lachnellula suecica TaxID=602035 RepID=A0A8T9CFN7_9HELO|nr:hypothetical protein LSUE1_G001789 [Lachnellula suecica]
MSVAVHLGPNPAPVNNDLAGVGLIEFLETDERPIFVLDLKSQTKAVPVFQNVSLQENGLDIGAGEDDSKYAALLEWALESAPEGNLRPSTHFGMRWSGRNLRNRWRIITGRISSLSSPKENSQRDFPLRTLERKHSERPTTASKPTPTTQDSLDEQLSAFRTHRGVRMPTFPSIPAKHSTWPKETKQELSQSGSPENLGVFDITKSNPTVPISPHVEFFLNFDWAATELGSMNTWSSELRRMVNLLMSDPRAAAMYWGHERTMIYNEPYVRATGQKHPGMMGKSFAEAWPEINDDFVPAFEKAKQSGIALAVDDARFYIDRHGYVEECYFTLSIIPIAANDGEVGFYNPVFDTSRQVITDRRMAFLLRLGQYIASSREPKDFWQQLLAGLEAENFDLPFGLLYSAGWDVNETLSESSEQSQTLKNWVLEGLVRVPEPHSTIPRRYSNDEPIEDFLPNFHEMIKSDTPTLLLTSDGTMPKCVRQNLKGENGEDIYEAAVFLPIRSTGDTTLGFSILGINPRKRFDDDYRLFIELLSRQLATSMAAALLFEDELRRGRIAAELAAHDRNLLSQKLATTKHEATALESRFRKMADLAPVGMFHIRASDGTLLYANNNYYE